MSFWQYNAWCEAYRDKQLDNLSLQVQAAYYGAYWSSATKHKKSLRQVLDNINKGRTRKTKRVPIDYEKVNSEFKQVEEIRKYGWTQIG